MRRIDAFHRLQSDVATLFIGSTLHSSNVFELPFGCSNHKSSRLIFRSVLPRFFQAFNSLYLLHKWWTRRPQFCNFSFNKWLCPCLHSQPRFQNFHSNNPWFLSSDPQDFFILVGHVVTTTTIKGSKRGNQILDSWWRDGRRKKWQFYFEPGWDTSFRCQTTERSIRPWKSGNDVIIFFFINRAHQFHIQSTSCHGASFSNAISKSLIS